LQQVRLRTKQAVVGIFDGISLPSVCPGWCSSQDLSVLSIEHVHVDPEILPQQKPVPTAKTETSNDALKRKVADMALELQVQTAVQRQVRPWHLLRLI
jgi:hypothetical protein